MSFAIQPGQTVVFTGDSITDCGRRGENKPFGSGYAQMCINLMEARYPDHQLKFINTGISGNTIENLRDRFTDDVAWFKPDWVSILIGINDLHRWKFNREGPVDPDRFALIYEELMVRMKNELKCNIVLLVPFYISQAGEESTGARREALAELPRYMNTVKAMAAKHGARLVDFHQMFQSRLLQDPADKFCAEPVHPNPTGHMHMAHAWLNAVGW